MADDETGIDANSLERLVRMVGEDKCNEIIRLFLVNAAQRVEAAHDGRRAGDLDAVALAMHALRSSSDMIGATDLCHAAAALEDTVRRGEIPVDEDWERLDSAWLRARNLFEERA